MYPAPVQTKMYPRTLHSAPNCALHSALVQTKMYPVWNKNVPRPARPGTNKACSPVQTKMALCTGTNCLLLLYEVSGSSRFLFPEALLWSYNYVFSFFSGHCQFQDVEQLSNFVRGLLKRSRPASSSNASSSSASPVRLLETYIQQATRSPRSWHSISRISRKSKNRLENGNFLDLLCYL
jgi:hypothetical protein